MRIIKPKKLNKGDVIGIISPASPPEDSSRIQKGITYLESLGYRVEVGKHIYSSRGYLAGEDHERLEDLHAMFKNKHVKAILSLRGGYGSQRLLDKINYKVIGDNPKIFVGYSDITALHMAIFQHTKMVTFAGPMLTVDFGGEVDPFTEENFWKIITSSSKVGKIHNPANEKFYVLSKGNCEGKILGGNLSIITSLLGTKYLPLFKDCILMLEEVNEPPYRVDRMLVHLRLAGVMKQLKGVILGRFVDCYESNSLKKTLTLNEVVYDHFNALKIPVIYNFKHGHVHDSLTVPLGVKCKLNSSRNLIEITENAVS